jgi:hypothetical protein
VTAFDLRSLVATLSAHEVEYIVVGGVAVGAHGYLRATRDLDLVPDPGRVNLHRLARTLVDLEARLPLADSRPFAVSQDLPRLERGANLSLETALGGIDVIQRAPGVPSYEALSARALDAELLGVPVRITSLAHLRAMKQVAGRPQDKADLEYLPESDPD